MGILVGCEQISMEWPGKKVLTNQTIGVNEGDRIGVVGKNGDGKSTLLDLIAKRIEPDSGNVIWRSGIQVGAKVIHFLIHRRFVVLLWETRQSTSGHLTLASVRLLMSSLETWTGMVW